MFDDPIFWGHNGRNNEYIDLLLATLVRIVPLYEAMKKCHVEFGGCDPRRMAKSRLRSKCKFRKRIANINQQIP